MNSRRFLLILIPLAVFAAGSVVLALLLGPSDFRAGEVLGALFAGDARANLREIAFLRLDRALAALLVGAALSAAGVVTQSVLRNPLAEPYILGISGAAGLASALSALVFGSILALSGLISAAPAVLGALGAVLFIIGVQRTVRALGSEGLILLGVMVNAFCGSMVIALASFMGEMQLMSFFRWLIGSFAIVPYSEGDLVGAGLLVLGLVFMLMFDARTMNLLSLSDDEARSLGVNVNHRRRYLLLIAGMLTAVSVSLAGLVGFVGLVVPHAVRRAFGADVRIVLPASVLTGAGLLVLCDTLARNVLPGTEVPVGVVTALLGAPVFVVILLSRSRNG
ncbi:MAG: iron ABC transporter permease [Planctomycetota bacterium]|nr:iron ABC transporter permease [Planctomycetota bacterium]